jgi:hypothetical protein
MGSNAFIQSLSNKEGQVAGSLMKFINIHVIDLIDENYLNIGAFTNEHMTEVIKKARDVPYTIMNLKISDFEDKTILKPILNVQLISPIKVN